MDQEATVPHSQIPEIPAPVLVREIHKNGWLKRIPSCLKKSSPFAKPLKPERQWVVFCVHDDIEAFLEFYENRRSAFSHKPLSSLPLGNCLHVSPNIVFQEDEFIFTVTLDKDVIKLAASSREQMLEWIDTMQSKLRELGILEPKDNLYSKEPEVRPILAPNRDPTSPLPPTPGFAIAPPGTVPIIRQPLSILNPEFATENVESDTILNNQRTSCRDPLSPLPPVPPLTVINRFETDDSNVNQLPNPDLPVPYIRYSNRNSDTVISQARLSLPSPPSTQEVDQLSSEEQATLMSFSAPPTSNLDQENITPSRNIFNFDLIATALNNAERQLEDVPVAQVSNPIQEGESIYECLHMAHTPPALAIRNPRYVPLLSPSQNESNSSQENQNMSSVSNEIIDITNIPITSSQADVQPFPLPLTSQNSEGLDEVPERPLSLKEAQVLQLRREINHPAGVRLRIRKKDCINSIAFVDHLDAVWVAGWKQREHPFLYNSFHIGDRIMSVGNRKIATAQEAHKALKHSYTPYVEFIIARVPFARVFAIKRNFPGQELGLIRENSTAEIKEVVTDGLAARHGLANQAQTYDGLSLCNWILTEINGRPLNLFFKDNEVEDRLNAVGKDISILVQPSDFVKALKKQLKNLRSYKDYIVQ